jgi:GTPase SAR1 family protein
MYDVTDKRSYLNVRNWMSTIADTAAENVAVLLVGNKIDLRVEGNKTKCVPTEEGLGLAKEYGIVFLETSVKTGTNLLPSMGRLIR